MKRRKKKHKHQWKHWNGFSCLTAKAKARDRNLQRKYGITLYQYDAMLALQDFCCAFCGKHKDMFKNSLHVDHDHKTGLVRGLLCHVCNRRYVRRHDRETAARLLDYMLRYYPKQGG